MADDAHQRNAASIAPLVFSFERFGECPVFRDGVDAGRPAHYGTIATMDKERRATLVRSARVCRAWAAAVAPCLPRVLVIPGQTAADDRLSRVIEALEASRNGTGIAGRVRAVVVAGLLPSSKRLKRRFVAAAHLLSGVEHLVVASMWLAEQVLDTALTHIKPTLQRLTLEDTPGHNLSLHFPAAHIFDSIQFTYSNRPVGGLGPLGASTRQLDIVEAYKGMPWPACPELLQRLTIRDPITIEEVKAYFSKERREALTGLVRLKMHGVFGRNEDGVDGMLAVLPPSVQHLQIVDAARDVPALLLVQLRSPAVLPNLRTFDVRTFQGGQDGQGSLVAIENRPNLIVTVDRE